MNTQRHVIKRQVLELPLSSSSELQLREQQVKRIYYQSLLPAIENYFNQLAKSDLHYQLDSIALEIKDFDWDNLTAHNFAGQVEQQLEIQVKEQITAQTQSMQSAMVQPSSRTPVQILRHFLQTGTLPWWAEELNRQQFDSWLQQILRQESAIIPLLRQAIAEPRGRRRCILQFSDTSLWHLCQKLLPSIHFPHVDSVPFSKNGVNYREIARMLGLDAAYFREQHWDTLLGLSMTNEQQHLTPVALIQKYWHKLARINDGKLKDWRNNLAKAKLLTAEQRKALADKSMQFNAGNDELALWLAELAKLQQLAIDGTDFAARLTRLEQKKPQDMSTQHWQVLKQQLSMLKGMLDDYQNAAKAKQIGNLTADQLKSEALVLSQECQFYLLNFEQNVARLELQLNSIQQFMARLQHIYKLPPPSSNFCEALQQLSTDLSTVFKPYLDGAIAQRCFGLLKYAKVRLLTPISDHELLKYTQKFYGLIDKELVKLQLMVDYARQNLLEVQQQLLPYQAFYQSLQTLLVSVEDSQRPLTDELLMELKRATLALVATDLRLHGQSLLGKLGQYQPKRNNTAAISSDIRNALCKLVKQASVAQSKSTDAFSDVEEVFVSNAGLVILWPYLGRFFTGIGLLTEGRFQSQEAAERAALLCHYLVAPNEQPSEPSLALNKLLCGLELAYPISLEITLTENEQSAIEELLSAAAGNWAALKTTNPNALRQLFLQRNGSLQIKDGNYLVRVERKSHDLLLDKLPWSIANIRLAWLDSLIRVEW